MTTPVQALAHHPTGQFLQGKCALITGGSRGIGRGVAIKLAGRGAHVAITYVENEAAARDVVAQIERAGASAELHKLDVAKPDDVRRLIDRVGHAHGSLDVLVSNARTEIPSFYAAPFELTDEQWQTALQTQATAFLHEMRAVSDLMPAGGRVIALTYGPGSRTGSWQSWIAMGAAKAALEALVRYFAVAVAGRGITVNAVSPGFIEDSVLNSLPEVAQNMVREWHGSGWTPMKRLGTPADIGNVVSLLCSPEASWITGQTIFADGGASIVMPELPPALQW
jgi:NAD(P)-dependent dehydrogenase (short-subunit alcohol dehydrogenase family)